ncbi:hypothetical protein NGRA_2597 [Nosema granulosis]|uniref:Uncharacterized protein n=1 Tax=Nosema granulosis TaxID=83296 RepID=A0A9P6GWB2_9MICR|nr:hypothetical protein NGRA_2597 [Nosema granulosis]
MSVTNIFNQNIVFKEFVDVLIKIDDISMNTRLFVADSMDNTLLLGNLFLKNLNKKKHEIGILRNKYKDVFNEKPSSGYDKTKCTIYTKENCRVNIKRRDISHDDIEGVLKKLLINYSNLDTLNSQHHPHGVPR